MHSSLTVINALILLLGDILTVKHTGFIRLAADGSEVLNHIRTSSERTSRLRIRGVF
jgi:hypothetical protein